MARIAFASELGGELGHATACQALAAPLRQRGHRIAFIFSSLPASERLPRHPADEWMQAPPIRALAAENERPCSYAEILVGMGYRDEASLAPMAQAWREVIEGWAPDLVVADSAPTALLSARSLGIRSVNFGNGFAIPPKRTPMPPFRFDEPVDPAHLDRMESLALGAANALLAQWSAPPLDRFSRLLECEEDFLCTFPELDHYGNRPLSGYWGPRFQVSAGLRAAWPAGGTHRVLAYLKPDMPQLDDVIGRLAESRCSVAAFVPGLEPERAGRLRGRRRLVFDRPMKLEPLLSACDVALGTGGDLAPGLLLHGIPQVLFPQHYEQYVTARRIEQLGAGLWLSRAATRDESAAAIRRVLAEPHFRDRARAFAARYRAFSPQEQARRIAARIEQIVARATNARPILATPKQEETR